MRGLGLFLYTSLVGAIIVSPLTTKVLCIHGAAVLTVNLVTATATLDMFLLGLLHWQVLTLVADVLISSPMTTI
jgi:hypothetical protein